MGVNGTFFDSGHIKAPAGSPATFTLHDTQGPEAQAYLTDYTITTALESGFTTGNTLNLTYLLEEYLNVTVTTDNLGVLIPEVLTKYGSGKAVALAGKFVKSPSTAKFTEGKGAATSNLEVFVTIDGEQAIQASFLDMAGSATLNTKQGELFGEIITASLGNIEESSFQTTLGLTASQLQGELQSQVDEAVMQANQNLTAGIQVPMVDLSVAIHDGYAMAGGAVTTSMWGKFTNFMYNWKMNLLNKKKSAPLSNIQLQSADSILY